MPCASASSSKPPPRPPWPISATRQTCVAATFLIASPGPRGEAIRGGTYHLLFNAHHEDVAFLLPDESYGAAWVRVVDTASGSAEDGDGEPAVGEVKVMARSLLVLRRVA